MQPDPPSFPSSYLIRKFDSAMPSKAGRVGSCQNPEANSLRSRPFGRAKDEQKHSDDMFVPAHCHLTVTW
jgi:hypothetical protein